MGMGRLATVLCYENELIGESVMSREWVERGKSYGYGSREENVTLREWVERGEMLRVWVERGQCYVTGMGREGENVAGMGRERTGICCGNESREESVMLPEWVERGKRYVTGKVSNPRISSSQRRVTLSPQGHRADQPCVPSTSRDKGGKQRRQ